LIGYICLPSSWLAFFTQTANCNSSRGSASRTLRARSVSVQSLSEFG
jgi:hypothetical protein